MHQSQLEFLVNYKAWADEVFYAAIANLPSEEITRDRRMLFGNILRLLNHTYSMDVVWRHNLQGTDHKFTTRNPEDIPPFSELRQQQSNINGWYSSYVNKLTDENCQREIVFTFIGDDKDGAGKGCMRVHEIIQHLVNHASYHRGHIEGVMYQLGVEPPTTDMPVYHRDQ